MRTKSNNYLGHSQIALLALSLCGAPAQLWAADVFSVGTSYRHIANLPNGKFAQDIFSDNALSLELSGGKRFQLTDTIGLTATAELSATQYSKFKDLDNVSAGVSSSLSKKFGMGYFAPVVTLNAAASNLASDHRPRDGWHYQVSLGIHKRLHQRFDLNLQYGYSKFVADNVVDIPFLVNEFGIPGDVFNLKTNTLAVTGIFSATERLSVYAG